MRKIIIGLILIISFNSNFGQTPTSCFEIESILVDACGFPEGENEMVRFRIGPADLNTADLVINWPNNPYKGICQNAGTDSIVQALNSTILDGCGLLVEPVGGVLPAGSKILLITSDSVDIYANTFNNLTDTLVTIFQCGGNTAGHFANYNSAGGIRTLEMSFTNPSGCGDTVSYDRGLLLNQNGTIGGSSSLRDGGKVNFAWDGTPTYANDGCMAPIVFNTLQIGSYTSTICPGDTLSVSAQITGDIISIDWYPANGTYSYAQDSLNTDYYSSLNDTVPFYLKARLIGICHDTIYDSILIDIIQPNPIVISPNTYDLCPGESINLQASGGTNYYWTTTPVVNDSILPINSAGTYKVIAETGCVIDSAEVVITANGVLPSASISGDTTFCTGQSVTYTASGGTSYLWSTGSTNSSIVTSVAGTYSLIASNNCGNDTASITLIDVGSPVNLSYSGDTILCGFNSATINVSGADNYIWNTGNTSNSVILDSAGVYTVVGTNTCNTDSLSLTIIDGTVTADFTMNSLEEIIPFTVVFTNTSQNATSYAWDLGTTTSTVDNPTNEYTIAGTYDIILIASNVYGCSDTATSVFVGTNSEVIFPNIFSPNGDEDNDFYFINDQYLKNVTDLKIEIYNRWGQKMGEINEIHGKWDGRTMEGELVPDGTYFFIAEVTYTGNEVKNYEGSFLLVR